MENHLFHYKITCRRIRKKGMLDEREVKREAWILISWMSGSVVMEMGLIGVKERM